uniref:Hexosyltransferase n=1 Tax=Ascaris lumbricoides TaxID=6252 RepID=A0A9J2Q7N3_ASCLU
MWRSIVVALSLSLFILRLDVNAATSLHVVTVVIEHQDALERLQRSANAHEIQLNILRHDQLASSSRLGGGEKLRILRDGLEIYKDRSDLILLYVDANKAIINGREEEILKRFMDSYSNSQIVFSSDNYCFPDEELTQRYPIVEKGKRFLNSAAFIGYANKICELLNSQSLENINDEQIFYTYRFLDERLRLYCPTVVTNVKLQNRLQMVLDSTSQIFHSVDVSKDEITLDFSDNGDAYNRLQMVLDSTSQIFHSVDVSKDEITLDFSDNGDAYITNVIHKTHPLIIHGDESNKLMLNYLGNYIGKAWSADFGCRDCSAQRVNFLKDNAEQEWPKLTLAIMLAKPIPFVEEFLTKVEKLEYPASKIDLYLYSNQKYNEREDNAEQEWPKLTLAIMLAKPIPFVEEFLTKVEKLEYPTSKIDLYLYSNQKYNEREVNEFLRRVRGKYSWVEWDSGEVEIGEREARRTAIDAAIKANNDFVFLLDANVHFVDLNVIRWIIESALTMNLGILAPMVGKPNKFFTNFWGAISPSGYYQRSEDYTEIVNYKRVGVWNVPFISSAILINKQKMREIRDGFFYNTDVDADLSFCQFARDNDHFLYVDNQRYYGFLADSETFDNGGKHLHPEMYQIFENRHLWESRYVHPDYFDALDGSGEIAQPCPDVYHYPLMSEIFA